MTFQARATHIGLDTAGAIVTPCTSVEEAKMQSLQLHNSMRRPVAHRMMSQVGSRSFIVTTPPRASTWASRAFFALWRWYALARTRRAVQHLDERLLRDAGVTRDGRPVPHRDWWG